MAHERDPNQLIGLRVKWQGNEYAVECGCDDTIADLKHRLLLVTSVPPARQKLMGLRVRPEHRAHVEALGEGSGAGSEGGGEGAAVRKKSTGTMPPDFVEMRWLAIGRNQRVMMVGTPDDSMLDESGWEEAGGEVLDDLDVDMQVGPADENAEDTTDEVERKLGRAVSTCKLQVMHEPRPAKKLCVLDLDWTLLDWARDAPSLVERKRPYLEQFLKRIYQHYDLAVWSQTKWMWVEIKLTHLGMLTSPDFKITFMMDHTSMFKVRTRRSNGQVRSHHVKPLEVIWRKFPAYTPANTVHIDDLGHNFALNPQNGIRVKQFKHDTAEERAQDTELWLLARYLEMLAELDDLSGVDHEKWRDVAASNMSSFEGGGNGGGSGSGSGGSSGSSGDGGGETASPNQE